MTSVDRARHVERIVGSGTEDFDRVRSRVESLTRIGAPSLIVPLRVTLARGDQVAVSEPQRESDTLRTVLDARGALRAGECVWLGIAVAQALAVLHKNGLVHGALDPDAIVVERGEVRLVRLVDGHDDAVPADDVAALGRLLAGAVRDSDADRIGAWSEPMTHTDPLGRPTAAMVVHALASCAAPEEVQLPTTGVATALRRAATSSSRKPNEGAVPLYESRWWRRRLTATRALRRTAVGLAVIVVLGGVVAGGAWVTHTGPFASPTAGNDSGVEQAQAVTEVAAQLTMSRFAALSQGDGDGLISLTVEGSAARADAESTAAALQQGDLSVDGLEGSVEESVRVSGADVGPPRDGDDAVVKVRYRLSPHVVTTGGESTQYDGYEQTVDLSLTWVDGTGWLVSDAQTT